MPNGRPGDNAFYDIMELGLTVFGHGVEEKVRWLAREAPHTNGLVEQLLFSWPFEGGKPLNPAGVGKVLDELHALLAKR